MALIPGRSTTQFEIAPAGPHAAICTRIIDMGLQRSNNPKYPKPAHKIYLQFEIDSLMQDGRPFVVGKQYTFSLSEKAYLLADLQSWRGTPFTEAEKDTFEMRAVLGARCMLNIMHSTDGKYANISAIMPLPPGMKKLTPVGDLIYFDTSEWDDATFAKLSEKMREKILNRVLPEDEQSKTVMPAYQQPPGSPFAGMGRPFAPPQTAPATADMDDDIPF